MAKVLSLIGLLVVVGLGAPGAAQTDKSAIGGVSTTLTVKGMACSACASKVEQVALQLTGVKTAKVSQPKGTAAVTFDPKKTSPEAIAKAITDKAGFKAEASPAKR